MHTTSIGDRHTRTGASGAVPSGAGFSAHVHAAASDLALDVRGLHCAYGHYEAVRGIDLWAHPGELLAVLGTNGAGKTTVLETLEGGRAPNGGSVRVLGLDPYRQRRRLAARVGVMLQDTALPDELTPTEFVQLWRNLAGGREARRPVDDSLVRVGLAQRRDVRIGRLSGGERRRLDLAVALSTDPELLFLDEPTTGLDPEARADAWDLVRDLLRRGKTIVLTTHYLEEAQALADRLAILHEGRVEVAGTLDEVLAARESRIRCELAHGATPPRDEFVGRATVTPDGGAQRLEIRTSDLARDLSTLLAWSETYETPVRRLQTSEPTLAEVFHDVRAMTTPEEAPR